MSAPLQGSLFPTRGVNAASKVVGRYRYYLTRWWSSAPMLAFVGLNPSVAGVENPHDTDRTVGRMDSFARSWGHGGYMLVNEYAFSATEPDDLLVLADPVGPDNDVEISKALRLVHRVVVCWGAHAMAARRSSAVLSLIREAGHAPECIRLTKYGAPEHPLYLPGHLTPIPFSPA